MFSYHTWYCFFVVLLLNSKHVTQSMKLYINKIPLLDKEPENEISKFIISKGHIPLDRDLPKASLFKSVDSDVTYLLSKLTDEELVRLLNEQPQKGQYNLKDIVNIATNSKNIQNSQNLEKDIENHGTVFSESLRTIKTNKNIIKTGEENEELAGAVFRLDNKQVDPLNVGKSDSQYVALQKLNYLLNSQTTESNAENKSAEEMKKELLFDVLVAQLKSLCCKSSKKNNMINFKSKPLLHDIMPNVDTRINNQLKPATPIEHMFLIINEEIKSNGRDEELILVDPDSLGGNSSVMLLGPVATPLSDAQLKIVMKRISVEISKPEYQPLLQQISDGTLSNENMRIASSLISGPQTRRYIKPHRCNHQSKLARVYGGPKWLICTGYLNINQPSLYD